MKDLSIFIKEEFIKNNLLNNSVFINTIEEADGALYKLSRGDKFNIKFINTSVKEYFLNNLLTIRPEANIINCNCSIDKFDENNFYGYLVFNNINKCKHPEIFEKIKKYNGVLLC